MATLKELAANPGTAKLEFDISVSMPARTIPGQWLKTIDMYSYTGDLGAAGTWNEAQASRWIYGIVNRLLAQNSGRASFLPSTKFILNGGGSISANQWTFDTRCTFNQRGKIDFAGDLSQASVSDVELSIHIEKGKEALDAAMGSPLWETEPNTPVIVDTISSTISNVMVNGTNAEEIQQQGEGEEDNPNAPLTIRGKLTYTNWIQTDVDVPGLAQMESDSPEWAKAFVYEPLSRAMGMEINEDNCAFGPVNMPGQGEWQVNYPVSQWQTEPTGAESVSCTDAQVLIALFNIPPDSLPINLKFKKAGDSWLFEKGLGLDITYRGRSI
ncbi:MAG: hypothetical protein IIZ04_02680 [Aeriscardovia sp.]|nr:hypothetical protein [Aeriscardovia sp.]